jgi:hypothetical protein
MTAYCDADDVKALLIDIPITGTSYDAVMNDLCEAASRFIDQHTKRLDNAYCAGTSPSTKYFLGDGSDELAIGEMCSLPSAVWVAETGIVDTMGGGGGTYTEWADDDYFTSPDDAPDSGRPITRLIVNPNGSGCKSSWPSYRRGIKISSCWGYSQTVPPLVSQACAIQVVRWWMRGKQGFQDAGAVTQLNQLRYVKELDPDVKNLLEDLMRIVI